MKKNEHGFHIIELSIALLVIIMVGLIGWRLTNNSKKPNSTAPTATVKPVSQDSINSKADLQKASATLSSIKQENDQTNSDLAALSQTAN